MGMPAGVRVVFFDLDGTLVFHQPDSFDVIAAFCAEIGQPLSKEAWRRGRRARHEFFIDPVVREELAGLSRDEFWDRYNLHMLHTLGVQGQADTLVRELSARFGQMQMAYYCPETGCQTLRALRARGYGLGLITNRENAENFYALVDRLGLRLCFDLLVVAGEVGVSKPDTGIFRVALERAGVTAQEALYVGDNYWADVVGARRAGIPPVLLDPYHLFPEAECPVLERIEDLLLWL
jgi:HAD superfamily hydrolase (TIGR01549 family)